jgi:adenylosuccinate lyase
MVVPNVLASRYASEQMRDVWSAPQKIVAERRLWLAVLAAQRDLGVDLGAGDLDAVVAAYERVLTDVDLDSIAHGRRSPARRQGRIEEFNALAGIEHVHKGMTSRDLTENVEQLQLRRSLGWCATGRRPLARLAELAVAHRDRRRGACHNCPPRPRRSASGSRRRRRAADPRSSGSKELLERAVRCAASMVPVGTSQYHTAPAPTVTPTGTCELRPGSPHTSASPGAQPRRAIYPRAARPTRGVVLARTARVGALETGRRRSG